LLLLVGFAFSLSGQGDVGFDDGIDGVVETDGAFPAEKRHESEQILLDSKLPYQINLYSGVSHGFAVRSDLKNRVAKYAKEQAFFQAVFWFDEHLEV
jgi:dienelactone hydrolase